MKFSDLQRFSPLYVNVKLAGSAQILNTALGFERDQVVPLSISHGVDFNVCTAPMDIFNIEPLHWAYNEQILERSRTIKPSISLPHPWWFIAKDHEIPKGERMLVIGPPPGKLNDERLLSVLKRDFNLEDMNILLKQRGDTINSEKFWMQNGVGVVTAGIQDENFYPRLFRILANSSLIISCTLSSAAIFAASIGKKIVFIRDYVYQAYDTSNYLKVMDFNSRYAKNFVYNFVNEADENATELARNLLGFTNEPIARMKARYFEGVSKIDSPTNNKSPISSIMREIALLFNRHSLASLTGHKIRQRIFNNLRVSRIEANEISIWLNGLNSSNFKCVEISYIKGKTEPGRAVE